MANYPITDIEGIGDVYGEKLRAAEITDTDGLLAACATRKGRATLAERTGISGSLLLTWANMADLYRIDGVGRQFAELLHASGVDTVAELKGRNAGNLASRMLEVNAEQNRTKVVPNESQLAAWIEQAKSLPAVIEH
ncbi:MAG TPA: DUF4332 domain-containing protein [Phycisphaerales bacterium]|nr:DUF4332 domain-containing protein [Phycisphaerales bacterium]HMP36368.1 DUF4332 domain-containing protein [Phycisphaerales bacterium]